MRRAGFTLVELLVVLAVLAVVMAMAVPVFTAGRPRAELDGAALQLAASLRQARGQAIASNRSQAFTIDLERRLYWAGEGATLRQLPPDIDVSLVTATAELIDGTTGSIRFFADGGSTGGGVRVSRSGAGWDVLVDWLTGRVGVRQWAGQAN